MTQKVTNVQFCDGTLSQKHMSTSVNNCLQFCLLLVPYCTQLSIQSCDTVILVNKFYTFTAHW